MTINRIQKTSIPDKPMLCANTSCVYNDDYVCTDPRNNKGNTDAKCHKASNKKLLSELKEINRKTPDELYEDMHKPQEGTWLLTGPDGRQWKGGNPLACVKNELHERVPTKVRMERLRSSFILDSEESEREFEKWWRVCKYTQVIYADGMKQIAKDAWEACANY